jgi:hypothetical protein
LNETVSNVNASNANVSTVNVSNESASTVNALNANASVALNSMLPAGQSLILFAGPKSRYGDSMHRRTSAYRCWTGIARNGNACSGLREKCSNGKCSGISCGSVNGSNCNSENSNSGIFSSGRCNEIFNVSGNGMEILGRNSSTRRRFVHGVRSGCILAGILNGSIGKRWIGNGRGLCSRGWRGRGWIGLIMIIARVIDGVEVGNCIIGCILT